MQVFFVSPHDIQNGKVVITGELFHHLKGALRYAKGDEIRLSDGRGNIYRAVITRAHGERLEAEVQSKEESSKQNERVLRLAFAVVKRKGLEWILQKGTELGVSEFIPLLTTRTVVQPREERIEHQKHRWEKIILEAAQQSEGGAPPALQLPVDFRSFLQEPHEGIKLIFWEKEGISVRQALDGVEPKNRVTAVIGPEGGLTEEEIEWARAAGFQTVSLGKRKLRSETAVLAAVTVIQYELGTFG